jgi:RES domain-containing protein
VEAVLRDIGVTAARKGKTKTRGPDPLKLFRIADGRHAVWSGTGAMLVGGRFNSPGRPAIYCALSFAGAMLEVLVHARIGKVPKHHVWVEALLPAGAALERTEVEAMPEGWDGDDLRIPRRFGDQWFDEQRSAVLLVPSVVARAEYNAIVNPAHPDAARFDISEARAVLWDRRLFSRQ